MLPQRPRLRYLVIAADNTAGFRAVLEFCIVAAILLVLHGLYASALDIAVSKAAIAGTLVVPSTARADLIAYRAQHGRWPSAGDVFNAELTSDEPISREVDRLELEAGGALSIVFRDPASLDTTPPERRLSLRPGTVVASGGATVAWYCGGRRPPRGVEVTAVDQTNVSAARLPAACRDIDR